VRTPSATTSDFVSEHALALRAAVSAADHSSSTAALAEARTADSPNLRRPHSTGHPVRDHRAELDPQAALLFRVDSAASPHRLLFDAAFGLDSVRSSRAAITAHVQTHGPRDVSSSPLTRPSRTRERGGKISSDDESARAGAEQMGGIDVPAHNLPSSAGQAQACHADLPAFVSASGSAAGPRQIGTASHFSASSLPNPWAGSWAGGSGGELTTTDLRLADPDLDPGAALLLRVEPARPALEMRGGRGVGGRGPDQASAHAGQDGAAGPRVAHRDGLLRLGAAVQSVGSESHLNLSKATAADSRPPALTDSGRSSDLRPTASSSRIARRDVGETQRLHTASPRGERGKRNSTHEE
jgi:hypothetical protein